LLVSLIVHTQCSLLAAPPLPSGADLSNLLNEAAILTGRRNKDGISQREIDDSIDRIVAGMEGTPMTDGRSKMLVAYHEVRAVRAACVVACPAVHASVDVAGCRYSGGREGIGALWPSGISVWVLLLGAWVSSNATPSSGILAHSISWTHTFLT
jgi:hypothetical protein